MCPTKFLAFVGVHSRAVQTQCNDAILDCCNLLGEPRHCLGIVASSRGYIAGRIAFRGEVRGKHSVMCCAFTGACIVHQVPQVVSHLEPSHIVCCEDISLKSMWNKRRFVPCTKFATHMVLSRLEYHRLGKALLFASQGFDDWQDPRSTGGNSGLAITADWLTRPLELKSDARYILVVEKDCVFNRLVEDGFHNRCNQIFVLRALVSKIMLLQLI